jgi:hypothetical protein
LVGERCTPVGTRSLTVVGVQPGVLQGVGLDLGVEPDAAALLAEVEQQPTLLRDPLHRLAQLRAAVAALAAEHVAGEALAVQPHQRGTSSGVLAEREGKVLAPVGQPVEGADPGGGGVPVREPQRHGHRRPDRGDRQPRHDSNLDESA